jgi:hypothetical protein
MEQRERITAMKRELDCVTRDIRGVVDAIKAGVPGAELKTEMEDLQARKAALLAQMAAMDVPEPLLHPSMADVYRTKVEQLASALQADDVEQREAGRSGLRGLITKIVIPRGGGLLRVFGNLGEMLATAASGRDVSGLAAVAQSGCGGVQGIEVPERLHLAAPQFRLFLLVLLQDAESRHGRIERGIHRLVVQRALALPGLEVHGAEPLDLLLEIDARCVQLALDRAHAGGIDFFSVTSSDFSERGENRSWRVSPRQLAA